MRDDLDCMREDFLEDGISKLSFVAADGEGDNDKGTKEAKG